MIETSNLMKFPCLPTHKTKPVDSIVNLDVRNSSLPPEPKPGILPQPKPKESNGREDNQRNVKLIDTSNKPPMSP